MFLVNRHRCGKHSVLMERDAYDGSYGGSTIGRKFFLPDTRVGIRIENYERHILQHCPGAFRTEGSHIPPAYNTWDSSGIVAGDHEDLFIFDLSISAAIGIKMFTDQSRRCLHRVIRI